MNRITPIGELRQREASKRFTPPEKRYYAWLHDGGECCLTGQPAFDIAHTGSKAMAMKAPLDTCLPLVRPLHLIEERKRVMFWEAVGFADYLVWAADLYAEFERGYSPMNVIEPMQRKANRAVIADMLNNEWNG